MGSLILSSEEIIAIADALVAEAPPVVEPPVEERSGDLVYDQECASCHSLSTYDSSGSFGDLAGLGSTIVPKIEGGHQNKDQAMTPAELTALADYADTFEGNTGGEPAACDSCHGYPPTSGAHGVHSALNGVGTDCAVCHSGNNHNDGWPDLGFPTAWNAESGTATDNMDGTCSTIICHGGQQTPDWTTGSINVNTQCESCHVSGSSEYNGYASGEHRKHVRDKRYDCLVCHDANKLANGDHFNGLGTTTFEQSPASTIKSSMSYNNSTCQTAGCHGSERW